VLPKFLPAFLKIQDMPPKTRASAEPKTSNSCGQTAREQAAEMLQYEEDANQDVDSDENIQDVNLEDIDENDLSMEDLLRLALEAGVAARLASEREQLLQDGLKILHSQKDKMSIYCVEIISKS
jgi:hypothetical protein